MRNFSTINLVDCNVIADDEIIEDLNSVDEVSEEDWLEQELTIQYGQGYSYELAEREYGIPLWKKQSVDIKPLEFIQQFDGQGIINLYDILDNEFINIDITILMFHDMHDAL